MKLSTGVFQIDSPDMRAFPGGRGAGERENSGADDRADPEAGEIEDGRASASSCAPAPLLPRSEDQGFWFEKVSMPRVFSVSCAAIERKVRASWHPDAPRGQSFVLNRAPNDYSGEQLA